MTSSFLHPQAFRDELLQPPPAVSGSGKLFLKPTLAARGLPEQDACFCADAQPGPAAAHVLEVLEADVFRVQGITDDAQARHPPAGGKCT